jgi:glycosyltransferase involved in cell wall biosynthesis
MRQSSPQRPEWRAIGLRILQVNKYFYPHAGSETVLFQTRSLLARRGHEVVDFAMDHPRNVESPQAEYFAPWREYTNPEQGRVDRARSALSSVYSLAARRQIARLLDDHRPDVAHLHVIYHQLTLSIVDELHARGIPTVMTLHDYKIGCPAYVLYRDGQRCSLCTTGPVENVVVHRCIKGSLAASALAAVEARLVRTRRLYDKIDVFIAPSRFAAGVATDTGIPASRVHVVPNFLSDDEVAASQQRVAEAPRFLFAGRLEGVKGVADLLQVFSRDDPSLGTLVIAGAGGELEDQVREAARNHPSIEYLGRLTRDEVRAQLASTRAAILPSRWDENYPMSLLEARAASVPVIATRRGGLPDMVADGHDGYLVEAADPDALRTAVQALAADSELALRMGRHGHERFLATNTEGVHYEGLMQAYGAAAALSKSRLGH